ncbi:hypothetical protein MASR2M79_10780 [Aminivibrio sp.]
MNPDREVELLPAARTDEIHTDQPCYGSRRVAGGVVVRIAGIAQADSAPAETGILAIYPGPKPSAGDESPKFPYLLRGVDIDHPNHTGTDVTYAAEGDSCIFDVSTVLSLRRFVGIDSLAAGFVVEALD